MFGKIKALGIAAAIVLAIGVTAPATSTASSLDLEESAILYGSQVENHVFTLTDHSNGTVTCKNASFTSEGFATDGSWIFGLHPVYEGCTAFGINASVNTNGCNYIFEVGFLTTTGVDGNVDISCGFYISIVAATCEVRIASQLNLPAVEFTNSGGSGSSMDLYLHLKLSGIKYTVTKDNIGCPLSGTGSFTKGDYTGASTLRAEFIGPVGLTVS